MEKKRVHDPSNHILFTQLFVPMITIFEFFCLKKKEKGEKDESGEGAKFLASIFLTLCFWSYHHYYDVPGPLYSMHQLKRRLNSLLVGCILYSAVQIPLSFVLNSDHWIDYLFIVSLNFCFSIFFIKYSRHLSILRIKYRLSYSFPMLFIFMFCTFCGEYNKDKMENKGRYTVGNCQMWATVFLASILDLFLARCRFVNFVPPASDKDSLPISVVPLAFYNIV